ncbi:hypothetical protein [Streptomyces boluensis]|uniref:Uncharacterized protein n=1 Tax=Streptomyces boluensis TaxID=1775135 RepID=A0A964UJQ9_9ACTN|nr:hypothetical protein [Streptomyces boluensis]NBE50448.1 hypothetical protein [Streptomyces boluensis]
MPDSLTSRPAATATVIRVAEARARKAVRFGVVLAALYSALALTFVAVFARSATQSAEAWPSVLGGIIGLALPAVGVRGAITVIRRGRDLRDLFVATDESGVWVSQGAGLKVVPWDSLAATVHHWSEAGGSPAGRDHSLDLCPIGAIDPEDPVLGNFVHDDEPFRPGLPRLRYRFSGNHPYREALAEAVRQQAPHLWAGEVEREPGYLAAK